MLICRPVYIAVKNQGLCADVILFRDFCLVSELCIVSSQKSRHKLPVDSFARA